MAYKPSYLQSSEPLDPTQPQPSLGLPLGLIAFGAGSFWFVIIMAILASNMPGDSGAGLGMGAVMLALALPPCFIILAIGVIWGAVRLNGDERLQTRGNTNGVVFGAITLAAYVLIALVIVG